MCYYFFVLKTKMKNCLFRVRFNFAIMHVVLNNLVELYIKKLNKEVERKNFILIKKRSEQFFSGFMVINN